MNPMTRYAFCLLAFAALSGLAGCGKPDAAAPGARAVADDHKGEKPGAHGKAGESGEHAEESVIKLSEAEMANAGIKIAKVAEEIVSAFITVSATIQPNRDRFAHVAPRVPGRILTVPAKAGDFVRAGQVLATLDSVEVGESTSAYQQAASQLSVAKADFDRTQRLFDEQVVPQKDLLRARGEYEKARASAAAASDKLRMMGVTAGGGNAASTLSVTAPFAGTIIEKTAVLGELAQPDKPLFTVADLSTVWIEANLYEKDLGRVQRGAEAVVTVAAYPELRFKGKLAFVSAVMERESRTVKARIEVPNGDGRLKPEMFASASIQAEARGRAIAVPIEAVVLVDNRSTVFVKEADGYESRKVELGETIGERQIVKAGLNPGDEVVVAGTYALKSSVQKSKIGSGHAH